MKNILLLDTSIATNNIGDEIIVDSIRKNWKELFEENYICRYSTHTPPYSWWQQIICGGKFSTQKFADFKFLCGTNALYTNMLRPVPVWNCHIWNAAFYKDTILLGVGAGINSKKANLYTRYLYGKVLNKEYIHSVRDEYTKIFLEELGFKAYNTGCPTLWGLTPQFCEKIPRNKSKNVVFTLTCYHPDKVNDIAMIKTLEKEYENLYFWPQTLTDIEYINTLGNFRMKILAPNLEAYDSLLSTEVDYVGNRLHGGIRALQHGKRALIIAIDYRARNFKKSYSLPILERDEISELSHWINKQDAIQITGLDWDLIREWKAQFEL